MTDAHAGTVFSARNIFTLSFFRPFLFVFWVFFRSLFFRSPLSFSRKRKEESQGREKDAPLVGSPRSGREKRYIGRGSSSKGCGNCGKVSLTQYFRGFFTHILSTFSRDFRWTEFLRTFPTFSTAFPHRKP
ncbi:MAG TPA: hypothetical protein DDY70_04355 [Clostridiales bacterium]|nr:hypothetical protein [Clostridiales bacterium]